MDVIRCAATSRAARAWRSDEFPAQPLEHFSIIGDRDTW
jgi:hypothetical protein